MGETVSEPQASSMITLAKQLLAAQTEAQRLRDEMEKLKQSHAYTFKLAQVWLADGYLKQANDVLRNATLALGWTPKPVVWKHSGMAPIPIEQDELIRDWPPLLLDLRVCRRRIAAIRKFVWWCKGATSYEFQIGRLVIRKPYKKFRKAWRGWLQFQWAERDE